MSEDVQFVHLLHNEYVKRDYFIKHMFNNVVLSQLNPRTFSRDGPPSVRLSSLIIRGEAQGTQLRVFTVSSDPPRTLSAGRTAFRSHQR